MQTRVDEIGDRIYRLSTYAEPADLTFNQYLLVAEQPLLFHCGGSLADLADRPPRSPADGEVLDLGDRRVRWIDTSHVPHGWEPT